MTTFTSHDWNLPISLSSAVCNHNVFVSLKEKRWIEESIVLQATAQCICISGVTRMNASVFSVLAVCRHRTMANARFSNGLSAVFDAQYVCLSVSECVCLCSVSSAPCTNEPFKLGRTRTNFPELNFSYTDNYTHRNNFFLFFFIFFVSFRMRIVKCVWLMLNKSSFAWFLACFVVNWCASPIGVFVCVFVCVFVRTICCWRKWRENLSAYFYVVVVVVVVLFIPLLFCS